MNCPKCNAYICDDSSFCKYCGSDIANNPVSSLNKTIKIGRSEDNDIQINMDDISSYHCEMIINYDQSGMPTSAIIRDNGSTNGTFYAGQRINGDINVNLDDYISFSSYNYKIIDLINIIPPPPPLSTPKPKTLENPSVSQYTQNRMIFGKYKILNELGRGGMGIVMHALDTSLERPVAIKFLYKQEQSMDPLVRKAEEEAFNQFVRRFEKEARIHSKLSHPNIVDIYDFNKDELAIIMEFVDGISLHKYLYELKKIDIPEILKMFINILDAFSYIHSKNIIHKDIKSNNILIDKNNRLKITDFGISITEKGERITKAGHQVGTLEYMSPEQISDPLNLDYRTDIYQLGILLYEMLTKKVPFESDSEINLMTMQCKTPPPDPKLKNPEIDDDLAKIILKALEKRPDDRYSNCYEFKTKISEYLDDKEKKKQNTFINSDTQDSVKASNSKEYENVTSLDDIKLSTTDEKKIDNYTNEIIQHNSDSGIGKWIFLIIIVSFILMVILLILIA